MAIYPIVMVYGIGLTNELNNVMVTLMHIEPPPWVILSGAHHRADRDAAGHHFGWGIVVPDSPAEFRPLRNDRELGRPRHHGVAGDSAIGVRLQSLSMAAAGRAAVKGATVPQIENAAEIGMEHHLGMTCDPINGRVQVPCIERNSIAAWANPVVS